MSHIYEKPRMNFPQYGQFGYDQPVGKKHYQRQTAIKSIIFNQNHEEAKGPQQEQLRHYLSSPRSHYFQGKLMQLQREQSLQESRSINNGYLLYQSQLDKSYHHLPQQSSPNLCRRYNHQGADWLQKGIKLKGSTKRPIQRDSLDEIINPMKSSLGKERSFDSKRSRHCQQDAIPQMMRLMNPTFLNSIL